MRFSLAMHVLLDDSCIKSTLLFYCFFITNFLITLKITTILGFKLFSSTLIPFYQDLDELIIDLQLIPVVKVSLIFKGLEGRKDQIQVDLNTCTQHEYYERCYL